MKIAHIIGLEGDCAVEHGVETHTQGPDVHSIPPVPLIFQDFWGYVSRSATLLSHEFPTVPEQLANSEVADLYAALIVQQ